MGAGAIAAIVSTAAAVIATTAKVATDVEAGKRLGRASRTAMAAQYADAHARNNEATFSGIFDALKSSDPFGPGGGDPFGTGFQGDPFNPGNKGNA